jgi:hypothetical protein
VLFEEGKALHQKSGAYTRGSRTDLNKPPLVVAACNFSARPVEEKNKKQRGLDLRSYSRGGKKMTEQAQSFASQIQEQVQKSAEDFFGNSLEATKQQRIEQENRTLLAAGFEPEDEGKVLWRKNGTWFGRTASLQTARRIMRESTERDGWLS